MWFQDRFAARDFWGEESFGLKKLNVFVNMTAAGESSLCFFLFLVWFVLEGFSWGFAVIVYF